MARSASSPSAKRATKAAGRRSMSPEQRHRADLVDQMVATGRYTRAVAERILDRMPHALDPIPARVTEEVEVTTGFGTKWMYSIHKVDGGYTVTLRPLDVDARRKSGVGSTGGFISGTTLTGIPKVYRTQKEAYDIIVAHAKRGQYLLKKNPYRELEFRGMRRGMEAIPLKVIKAKSEVQRRGREYAKHMAEANREDNLALRKKHLAKAFEVESDAGEFIEALAEQVENSRQAKGILYGEFRAYAGTNRNPRTFRGEQSAEKRAKKTTKAHRRRVREHKEGVRSSRRLGFEGKATIRLHPSASPAGMGRGKRKMSGVVGSAQRQRAELAYHKKVLPDLAAKKGFIEGLSYDDLRGFLEERGIPEFRHVKSNPRTPEEKARRKAALDRARLTHMGPKEFEAYQSRKADMRRIRPLENAAFEARRALEEYERKYGAMRTQKHRLLEEALQEAKYDLVRAGGKVKGYFIGEKEVITEQRRFAK